MIHAALILLAIAGCGDNKYLLVTVDSRPTVHLATQLRVTLSNAGSTVSDTRSLDSNPFPVTFTVEANGRSGDLGIQVDALDASSALVGQGAITTPVNA